MARKAGSLFTTAYLLLIFGVYPFYMEQGYVNIGEAKYHFFLYCSLGAVGLLTLVSILWGVQALYLRCRQKSTPLTDLKGLSLTDIFVMLFATELFLSYVYSDYHQEALRGTDGWYMGLILFLILCGMYFFISRLWTADSLICHVGMTVSGIVFLLGILDRFSFYLIPLEIRQPGFISTLGNINWFCGYLSVLAPLGICPLIFTDSGQWPPHSADCSDRKIKRHCCGRNLIYISYTIVAFTAGFCQGSNSIFLFWAALLFGLLWIAARQKIWLINCLLPVFLWCFSAWLVRMLLFLFPEGYNYEADNPCLYLANSNGILLTGITALILFVFLRKKVSRSYLPEDQYFRSISMEINLEKTIHRILILSLSAGLLLWLCLSLINTKAGIPLLSQNSLFLLNASWGNGRGATLKAGLKLFCRMPLSKKILGAGPDCFSSLAYSLPDVADKLYAAFGSSRLTNAHNELLTSLVNTGIVGTFLYLGIFLSFMARCLKRGNDHKELYFGAICVFCYLVHNLVSFSQVLNLPFIFLIMGMGEAILREK